MIELLKQLFVSLDEDKVINIALRCLSAGFTKNQIISALNNALEEIGIMYSDSIYTLSDLMMAGIMYEEIISRPEFDISCDIEKSVSIGTIILGTIENDIHDIGKSIFKSASVAAGFEVVDAGVDVLPEVFCDFVKTYKPDILAISSILTTTIPHIQKTIDLLKKENLRDNTKIIIGGSIMTSDICDYVGADAFTTNALDGLEICKQWMDNK